MAYPILDRTWSRDKAKARAAAQRFTLGEQRYSRWERLLHGLAATAERGHTAEAGVFRALRRIYPTPEAAKQTCPRVREALTHLRTMPRGMRMGAFPQDISITGVLNPGQMHEHICGNAANWSNTERLLSQCPEGNDLSLTCCIGGNTNPDCKARKRYEPCKVPGLKLKGGDLALLFQGCDVPVMDRWMIWHLLPVVEPNAQRARRGDTDAMDKRATEVHNNAAWFKRYRDEAFRQAKAEGLSVAEWHYGVWLDLVTCKKSDPATGACLQPHPKDLEKFLGGLFRDVGRSR